MRNFLPLAGISLLLASCAGQAKRDAQTGLTTGLGALIGNEISDGEPWGAVAGAATGYATGKVLERQEVAAEQKSYRTGYDKGRSDAVKQTYWIKREMQEPGVAEASIRRRYYEVPVPPHRTRDGVEIEGHTRVIEVVE
jgi:hypothetical protein